MKGLRVVLPRRTEKVDISQQCVLAAKKANHILGCIPSSVASRLWEEILPLYSALVRVHLESCTQLWSPQHRKDMDMLEWAQRRVGTPLLLGKAEGVGAVQPGEEKAAGRPYGSLPVAEGSLQDRWRGTF